ncbi:Alg14 [Kluyveromyces lactis]|nr:Alg14 [Kluyveromyces lactis]
MLLTTAWCLLIWSVTLLLVRICLVIPIFHSSREAGPLTKDNDNVEGKMKNLVIFIFLGSGGHTGEMLRLIEHYRGVLLESAVTIHVGYSDDDSIIKFKNKIHQISVSNTLRAKVIYHRFDKARDVGSSLAGSIKSIIKTAVRSMLLTYRIKSSMRGHPNLTLLNGPGTCCIITFWLKLYHIFLWQPSKIVYVESLARTNRLSLTGMILYPLADEFVVQWADLLPIYPKAKYYGVLV